MIQSILKVGVVPILLSVFIIAAPASAQDNTRGWEQGSVWSVNYVRTKPGQFNAYINDLSNVYRAFLEAQKADGDVLSYRMLSVTSPRDGEANLILLIEFKDFATFDRTPEYFDEMTTKIMGSLEESRTANIDRGALRDLLGGLTARELHFKDSE
jgi:hypothetical protein